MDKKLPAKTTAIKTTVGKPSSTSSTSTRILSLFQEAAKNGPLKDEANCPIIYNPRDAQAVNTLSGVLGRQPQGILVDKVVSSIGSMTSGEKATAVFVTTAQLGVLQEKVPDMNQTRIVYNKAPRMCESDHTANSALASHGAQAYQFNKYKSL
ncbi:hypothetical protein VTI74DRAFT_11256 [Chaetomium olivicolor]